MRHKSGPASESEPKPGPPSAPGSGFTLADFRHHIPVSGSVARNLALYHDMLVRWQRRFNLVSATSLREAWFRHFFDSAQIFPLIGDGDGNGNGDLAAPCVDMGTGAGFPGLVLAIMGARDVHLVESDASKAEFLRQVIRRTGVRATVHARRLETYDGPAPKLAVSRACADLKDLLAYWDAIRHTPSRAVFLKGRTWRDELTRAERVWHIDCTRHPSRTDNSAMILEIHDCHRR